MSNFAHLISFSKPKLLPSLFRSKAGLACKFGGEPVGLPLDNWPTCAVTGAPMTFIAQFRLDSPVKLSERYRMAYAFMCTTYDSETSECGHETFKEDAGHTSVIVIEQPTEQVIKSPVKPLKEFLMELMSYPGEPLISHEEALAFEKFSEADKSDDLEGYPHENSRLGGRPAWFQGVARPRDASGLPMIFIAEIDAMDLIDDEPRVTDFVSDGMFFFFFSEDGSGKIAWQCT